MEEGKEDSSVLVKNVTVRVVQLAKDVNIAKDGVSAGCHDEFDQTIVLVYMQLNVAQGMTKSEDWDDVCVRRRLDGRAIYSMSKTSPITKLDRGSSMLGRLL